MTETGFLPFLVNHLVLPPKLPQSQEENLDQAHDHLLEFIHEKAAEFERLLCSDEERRTWASMVKMFRIWKEMTHSGSLSPDILEKYLMSMEPNGLISVYVRAQNAGLIFRKSSDNLKVTIDSFEASPQTEAVMNSQRSLHCTFPNEKSVEISSDLLKNQNFVHEAASLISELNNEAIDEAKKMVKKAGGLVPEDREVRNQKIIGMLMAIFLANGSASKAGMISKRIRDDVCWDSSYLPWRRSPLWTTMRVALQIGLIHSFPKDRDHRQYKNFVAFVISDICQKSLWSQMPSHLIHAISTKLVRRLSKTGFRVFDFVNSEASKAIEAAGDYLDKHLMVREKSQPNSGGNLGFFPSLEDVNLELTSSKARISTALSRQARELPTLTHSVSPLQRLVINPDGMPAATSISASPLVLLDFERWVEEDLQAVSTSTANCLRLRDLLDSYYAAATTVYAGMSEQNSLMGLTLLEIWVEMDKMVCQEILIMKQFSPELPVDIAGPLLLPNLSQMKRLAEIEKYLDRRHVGSCKVNPSHFAKPLPRSFAVQFYDGHSELPELRFRIESAARQERIERKNLWQSLNNQYNSLLQQSARIASCTMVTDRWGVRSHAWYCQKCDLKEQAAKLSIDIHEWPLPEAEERQMPSLKTVIFELSCPQSYTAWRDVSWKILKDLGQRTKTPGNAVEGDLKSLPLLHLSFKDHGHRIRLSSKWKTFARSHYRAQKFPTTFENICKRHALRWELHDDQGAQWTDDQKSHASVSSLCNTPLSGQSYHSLQPNSDTTYHSTNETLAKQEKCHKDLSLHEFQAFCDVRYGEKTQWYTILLELSRPVLTLNTEAVSTHLLQTAIQAGSRSASGKPHRTSHELLMDSVFARKLLEKIDVIRSSISANWKEADSMAILINLVLRILQLTHSKDIENAALCVLDALRSHTFEWMGALLQKLSEQVEETSRMIIQRKLLKCACLCRQTFDMEELDLDEVLKKDGNVAILVESATIVHDNIPGNFQSLDFDLRRCVFRDRRISHQLQEKLCSLALERPSSIDLGIKNIWSQFSASGPWKRTVGNNQAWISVQTRSSQTVDFNVFSGELLVNGQHLRTLPRNYMEDRLYIRIFNAQILQVIPSDVPYMNYMTTMPISGHTVYFGMEGNRLIIRAKDVTCGTITELIPDSCFHGDIPYFMISKTAQWLDIDSRTIYFRPLSSIWDTTTSDAQLKLSSPPQMLLAGKKLVEYQSRTGKRMLKIFSPIEQPKYLMITMSDTEEQRVEVKLQRFGITFFVNTKRELESNDLAATIDNDQKIGTFIGLHSRLVLKHLSTYNGICKRSILVPFGEISLEKVNDHTHVKISAGDEPKCTWFRWEIDTALRQLRNRHNEIFCRLFQIYLHAVTAHCRADPLTGRSGTEEAISGLQEPALLPHVPFDSSSPEDALVLKLLGKIAALTPARNFYPPHLRKMQTTSWINQLSPLAQHDEFVVLVERIVAHSNRLRKLAVPPISDFALEDRGDSSLLQKARIRNAILRPWEFGGSLTKSGNDSHYTSQDASVWCSSANKTFQIASLVDKWQSRFYVGVDLKALLHSWRKLGYTEERVDRYSVSELLHLQLNNHWGSLYNMCRSATMSNNRYQLMFLFGKMAFGDADLGPLRFLLAVAVSSQYTFECPPSPKSYDLSEGLKPKNMYLVNKVEPFFQECDIDARTSSNWKSERQIFGQKVQSQTDSLVNRLQNQWPVRKPVIPPTTGFSLLKISASRTRLEEAIHPLFITWFENYEFEAHLERISTALRTIHIESSLPQLPSIQAGQKMDKDKDYPLYKSRCISSLCSSPSVYAEPGPMALFTKLPIHSVHQKTAENAQLKTLTHRFTKSSNQTDRIFGDNLAESIRALKKLPVVNTPTTISLPIKKHKKECKDYTESLFQFMIDQIGEQESHLYRLQQISGLSPRITPTSVLRLLASSSSLQISARWKALILQYGISLTILQRAERLQRLAKLNDISGFYKEIENRGHENWDPKTYPDWLLMEIEGGFLIRRIQVEVALAMIFPESNRNTLMQLNMGEGKSSVIIALVAAILANGTNLARVIVLKALVNSMSSILRDRLGHMVNRTIFYCPFSRKTDLSNATLECLFSLWDDCCKSKEVLLVQPEHLQSFKLIGVEQISGGNVEENQGRYEKAMKLLTKRRQWEQNGRNIIDESDAVLDAKCQLIYTIGKQQAVDGESDRWQLIEELLTLVRECVERLPQGEDVKIKYPRERSSFPEIMIRQGRMTEMLNDLLVEHIIAGKLRDLHFQDYDSRIHLKVKAFIRDPELSYSAQSETIRKFHGNKLKKVLLLRGLIAGKVLFHCLLQKRWSVEFGLDQSRILLAVPYIAKGVPSPSAEFGHPDVAITLTCLSYYMTGLTDDQLSMAFEMLYKSTDPSDEYENWGRRSCKPTRFASLKGVNLDDLESVRRDLYPHLRYNKATIDFFLSNIVFPKDCKEFPKKLTTSAWDIPSSQGVTTGFSGTNDNRYLLPLSVVQKDLPKLVHTAAMVLSYILRPENSYQCVQDSTNQRLSVEDLLKFLSRQTPAINVLIDVGAQVLELGNKDVVKIWLAEMPHIEAAVFFDKNDKPLVMTRDGQVEVLSASRYQDRLEYCVVYMDEVHTRGTDLRLPANFKAAVTLGPRVTKDRFVQVACGCASWEKDNPEVDRDVRDLAATTETLSTFHALQWCLEQTRLNTQRNQPLWVHHGLTYYSNKHAEEKFFSNAGSAEDTISPNVYETLLEAVQEDDAVPLLEMYGPRTSAVATSETLDNFAPSDAVFVQELEGVRQTLGNDRMKSSSVNEEQEKEVAHEKEVQTEIERPPPEIPLDHASHDEVKKFIQKGFLPPTGSTDTFKPAFEIFSRTSAAQHGFIIAPSMIVTKDFTNSIKSKLSDRLDEFLKPTNYILTRTTRAMGEPVLVFISQYEANLFLEEIRESKMTSMHLFAPKTAREMVSLDDLKLFITPSTTFHFELTTDLRLLLGIFSGQLYLNSYNEYQRLCKLLLACYQPPERSHEGNEPYDLWIRNEMLEFVRSVFEIRRKGQGFSRTHMGRIVNKEILTEKDFDL